MTLSVDDLREHVTTDLVDAALTRILNGAYAAIAQRVGATGARTEILDGGKQYLAPSYPIASVTSATETWFDASITLSANDYRTRADGYLLERLRTGTNPRLAWFGDVTLVYTPVDDSALRDVVAIELCKLLVTSNPGLTSETVGSWTEQYAANSVWNTTQEYESILSRLDPEPQMAVVGGNRWYPA